MTAARWAMRRSVSRNSAMSVTRLLSSCAAHDVSPADTRLTGPNQYAVRDRNIQNALDDTATQAIGRTTPSAARFDTLVDTVDPRIRRDPYWPQLAAHLAEVARTDIDLSQLLGDVAAEGPLPDQMPGAAV
jgi:hypothetical protein